MRRDPAALHRLRELREVGHSLGQQVGQGQLSPVPPAADCPGGVGQQNGQKTAKSANCPAVPLPSARDSGTAATGISNSGTAAGTAAGTVALPEEIRRGLLYLRGSPAPRITLPKVWSEIIADALRLADGGFAAQALSLGWEPLQLFGVSEDAPGLAVWLAGRRILLLDDATCIVEAGPNSRAIFNRRPVAGAVFLWELGKRHVR